MGLGTSKPFIFGVGKRSKRIAHLRWAELIAYAALAKESQSTLTA